MKILIFGASGMLGHVVSTHLKENGHSVIEVSNTRRFTKNTHLLDVTNFEKTSIFLNNLVELDFIINCAAILVKRSEIDKSNAILLNSYFPHFLEEKYASSKTKIIHISSDGIFLGDNAPYSTKNLPCAKNFYAKTKIAGELDNYKDLTIRTSVIGADISYNGEGLLNWFVTEKGEIRGYTNVFLNGVTNLELAKFIMAVMENNINGIFHLGTLNSYSKYYLLTLLNEVFHLRKKIGKNSLIKSDNTLTVTNTDFYVPKSIETLVVELRDWIYQHKYFYNIFDLYKGLITI